MLEITYFSITIYCYFRVSILLSAVDTKINMITCHWIIPHLLCILYAFAGTSSGECGVWFSGGRGGGLVPTVRACGL